MDNQKLCATFESNVPAKVFNKGYVPASLATGYHVLMRSVHRHEKICKACLMTVLDKNVDILDQTNEF